MNEFNFIHPENQVYIDLVGNWLDPNCDNPHVTLQEFNRKLKNFDVGAVSEINLSGIVDGMDTGHLRLYERFLPNFLSSEENVSKFLSQYHLHSRLQGTTISDDSEITITPELFSGLRRSNNGTYFVRMYDEGIVADKALVQFSSIPDVQEKCEQLEESIGKSRGISKSDFENAPYFDLLVSNGRVKKAGKNYILSDEVQFLRDQSGSLLQNETMRERTYQNCLELSRVFEGHLESILDSSNMDLYSPLRDDNPDFFNGVSVDDLNLTIPSSQSIDDYSQRLLDALAIMAPIDMVDSSVMERLDDLAREILIPHISKVQSRFVWDDCTSFNILMAEAKDSKYKSFIPTKILDPGAEYCNPLLKSSNFITYGYLFNGLSRDAVNNLWNDEFVHLGMSDYVSHLDKSVYRWAADTFRSIEVCSLLTGLITSPKSKFMPASKMNAISGRLCDYISYIGFELMNPAVINDSKVLEFRNDLYDNFLTPLAKYAESGKFNL